MKRGAKSAAATLKSEGALAAHVRASARPLNPQSLARSYGLTPQRVGEIIIRNGGRVDG